uniref:Uncharacterized protein n=1 Tax=Biomphalaria glabrata TaxID=6526 RepID=A0A2C9LIV4_BIOGL
MSKDRFDQGHNVRTSLHQQASNKQLNLTENGEIFLAQLANMQRAHSHLDEPTITQKDIPHTFWKVQPDRELMVQLPKEHIYLDSNHQNQEEHLNYTHQTNTTMSHGQSSSVASSADSNSLKKLVELILMQLSGIMKMKPLKISGLHVPT